MKKLVLSAAFVALGMGISNAQEPTFGVKGGLNLASLGGDIEDVDALTSFHIGGFAQFEISEKFMIQPELLYSAQGAVNSEESDLKIKLDYINLPIMAKYMVAEGFSLEGGPYVGFAINREASFDGDSVDLDDEFKSLDYGVGLGAGYELDSGLMFSLRYNLGLANIADEFDGEDFSINNNVLQVSVGYKFN
jgi:hypothetical protein